MPNQMDVRPILNPLRSIRETGIMTRARTTTLSMSVVLRSAADMSERVRVLVRVIRRHVENNPQSLASSSRTHGPFDLRDDGAVHEIKSPDILHLITLRSVTD